jgi:hypothetical protein
MVQGQAASRVGGDSHGFLMYTRFPEIGCFPCLQNANCDRFNDPLALT